MRRFALVLVLAVVGCKKGGSTTTPEDPVTSPEPTSVEPAQREDPNAPPKCTEKGRVWDGHHEGCLYEVRGCCYDAPQDACEAAGCPEDCQILESAPAQIACPRG